MADKHSIENLHFSALRDGDEATLRSLDTGDLGRALNDQGVEVCRVLGNSLTFGQGCEVLRRIVSERGKDAPGR